MLQVDPDTMIALQNSRQNCRYVVTAEFGGEQTIPSPAWPDYPSVPIETSGQLELNLGSQTTGSGTLYVANDAFSLIPLRPTDPLAARGQELVIAYEVDVAGAYDRIPLGVYRIQFNDDGRQYFRHYAGGKRLAGWSMALQIVDRFDLVVGDDFLTPTSPSPTRTVLQEAAALALDAGVVTSWGQDIPDGPIPANLTYDSTRADAIASLLDAIGCVPSMTRQGALTAVLQNRWQTAGVADVDTILQTISLSSSQDATVPNTVVITNSMQPGLVGIAQVDNPASEFYYAGPYGRRVVKEDNPLMTTQSQINAAAQTRLKTLMGQAANTFNATALPCPQLELGDLILAEDAATDRSVIGQVTRIEPDLDPTAVWSLELSGKELTS